MVNPPDDAAARPVGGVTAADDPSVLLSWADGQWFCEAANPAWRALTGSSADQLIDAPIGALLPDRFVAEALGRLCDLAALTSTARRLTTAPVAGSPRVATAVPLPEDDRTVRVALTLGRGPAQPSSPQDMRDALESGALVFDRGLRVVDADPAVSLTSGVSREEILGRTNREMGYPDDLVDLWDAHVGEVFETGEPTVATYTLPTVLGPRLFESLASPVRGPGGEVAGVRVTSWDVTHQRLVEAPLRGWHAERPPMVAALWEGFEATPRAVAAARRAVHRWLDETSLGRFGDAVLLAVSELATNAAMHAGTVFYVHAHHSQGVVRIGVHDGSATLPLLRAAGSAGGRGLALVESVASSWGADPLPGAGKVVWCAFAAADQPDEAEPSVGRPGDDEPTVSPEELIELWAD